LGLLDAVCGEVATTLAPRALISGSAASIAESSMLQ
jgi:hypothetical protein